MDKKGIEFINQIENKIIYMSSLSTIGSTHPDITHALNILELVKYERYSDLGKYINDGIEYTENKNYSYKVRDRLNKVIQFNREYLESIENDE